MKNIYIKKVVFFAFVILCLCGNVCLAQHIDEVYFGNAASETAHGLNTYSPSKIQVFSGQSGQVARRFLPDLGNPYQGSYAGTYGGEMSFVMRVDSTQQNYFTVKFAGDSANYGRIILNVEGLEVGGRHANDEELFMETTAESNYQPLGKGEFFYRTAPIPRVLTDHKAFVTIRLRSTGWYFYYGTPGNYATYQRTLDVPTTGVYLAYMHNNPAFALPVDDVQGATPNYAAAPSTADDINSVRAAIIQQNQNKITNLLAGSNSIITDPNDYYNNIEVMAVAYNIPDNTVAYHNQAVIDKIRNAIDQHVVNSNNGTQLASASWGGAFGRSAYAVFLVYEKLTGLDDVVDLGGGPGLTRRAQWIKIFQASFDFGSTNRKSITNQEMEMANSVYGASLGLSKLDPVTYGNYPNVAFHLILESIGIEQCTGPLLNLAAKNPTLNTPATAINGPGFYFMTVKGTSHEPGWVSPDCYGNLAPKMMEFFYMTKQDPNITAYGIGNGDTRILNKALIHTKTQAGMTYPWTYQGNKSILSEGLTCWRNAYVPGETFYGNPLVAAETGDSAAIGYMKQMLSDGQFGAYYEAQDPKLTFMHFVPNALAAIAASTSSAKIPSTPGQSDYVTSDEGNGIIGIKKGDEHLFVSFYMRAAADNKVGKVHYITPSTERKIELKSIAREYYPSTSTNVRSYSVLTYSGDAPDKPISAYGGEIDTLASYNRTTAAIGNRQLLDFYAVQVGKYLIAMNTTGTLTKTITVPVGMVGKSGYNVGTGMTGLLPATISLPPLTTAVYFVADVAETPGLIADPTPVPTGVDKSALASKNTAMLAFDTLATTVAKVSTFTKAGNYHYELFDIFNRKLTVALFVQQYPNATQSQTDTALAQLTKAYNDLVGSLYTAVDPYQRVEAESYSTQSGIQTEATSDVDGNLNLSFVDAGDYTSYSQLDFKTRATKFYVRYAIPTTATTIELHMGSTTGMLVGKITLQPTGGNQTWRTDSCKVYAGANGIKDLYLVYGGRVNVNWFVFDSTATSYLPQTITFPDLPTNVNLATADFAPGATASSGLNVTYTSSNASVATIVNGTIHITGAGLAYITAAQTGNWSYDSAVSIRKLLTVTGIAAGDYVSTASTSTWAGTWNISDGNGGYTGTSTTPPTTSTNVFILSGHTVTASTTAAVCKNLNVAAGGTLIQSIGLTASGNTIMNGTLTSTNTYTANSDLAIGGTWTLGTLTTSKDVTITSAGILKGLTTAGGSVQTVNFGGANPMITIDGQFGAASVGATGESIRVYVTATGTTTFTGAGKVFLARFQPNNTSVQNIVIDVNMNFSTSVNNVTGFTLQNNAATTNSKSLTINAGKTVTLSHANCGFHNPANATSNTSNLSSMTYNINGTLDVSVGAFVFYSSNNTASPTPLQNQVLNIGTGGVLKLGANVRMAKAMATQTVAVNVSSGGIIDGSSAALNLITAPVSSNGTGPSDNVWFTLAPTALYKRLAAPGVAAPFWVGSSNTSYTPVTLTPTTGSIFTVGVADGISPSGLPDTTSALNKTWTITPVTASSTALTFGYNATDGYSGFNPAAAIYLKHYNSTTSAWENIGNATPSSGTMTAYTASFTGITNFSPFALGNSATILPVAFISVSATKTNADKVTLQWKTANEVNVKQFAVERSNDGVNYFQIAIIPAQNMPLNSYSYTDQQPNLSSNYYRLKEVDADSNYAYSAIRSVGFSTDIDWSVFPNPVLRNKTLTIRFNKPTVNKYVSIYDLNGKLISSRLITSTVSTLSVSGLGTGIYTIKLDGGNSKKIIVE